MLFSDRHFLVASLFLVQWMFPSNVSAQSGVPLWTNRYNGLGNGGDQANAIAVGVNSNVFVTGYSDGLGTGTDYATVAYSNDGAPLWTNRYNGTGNSDDIAAAIATDASGSVFVAGRSINLSNRYDYITIKYSNSGVPLWTNVYDGPVGHSDYATALALDSSGDLLVTGYSARSSTFPFNQDYATIKYSTTGVPMWTNRYNGPMNGDDVPSAIAVDASNNVFVTGTSRGFGDDYATIKYSADGVPLWTNRYDGTGNQSDVAGAIALDDSGNAYVTGRSIGLGGNFDFATLAYSSAGLPLWTNRYNGPQGFGDGAYRIAVGGGSKVVVTGYSETVNGGEPDYVTIAYSTLGVPLWTNRYNGSADHIDTARAVSIDAKGNLFVAGYTTTTSGGYDYATIAYSARGIPLWTNLYSGGGNEDRAGAIAVDGAGNVYVTGHSYGPASFDFATIKYGPTYATPIPLQIQQAGTAAVLSWTDAAFALQSAATLGNTFTNIPGATSPYTNSFSGSQRFFRLIAN